MSSKTDLDYYLANKTTLSQEMKRGLASKRTSAYVGLRNHGATCYLNSLIQCLYHDTTFRNLILSSSTLNDNQQPSAIIAELQRLFSRLSLSEKDAVDTEALLTAFGWSKSQLFEQHDIHEFFIVLLDALGKESAHLNEQIAKMFQGTSVDVLRSSENDYSSSKASSFLNISLDIPDQLEGDHGTSSSSSTTGTGVGGATSSMDLQKLLELQLQTEVLDEDNKLLCDDGTKVRATKSLEYQQLPNFMMVHLKRFRYDPTTRRRRKLNTAITFPHILDASTAFRHKSAEEGGATAGTAAAAVAGSKSPTATGTAATHSGADDEPPTRDGQADSPNSVSAPFPPPPSDATGGATFGKYQLTGVILHTGTAMGGHYRCYVKPTTTTSSDACWIDCNDANVCEIPAAEMQAILQLSRDESVGTSTSTSTAGSSMVQENAYMLIYKAIPPNAADDADATTATNAVPSIPAHLREEILQENASFAEMTKLRAIKQQLVELTVRVHPMTAPSSPTASSTSDITAGAGNAAGGGTVVVELLRNTTLLQATEAVHSACVTAQLLDGANYPIQQSRLRRYAAASATATAASGSSSTSSGSNRLGETFGSYEDSGNVTLEDINLTASATLALEVRVESDPPFVEFNPNDMLLQLLLWNMNSDNTTTINGDDASSGSSSNNSISGEMEILVPGREAASLADLKSVVLEKLSLTPADKPRLLLIRDNSEHPVQLLTAAGEEGNDNEENLSLVKDCFVFPGTSVVVELIPSLDLSSSEYASIALESLKKARNSAVIYFNNPFAPTMASAAGEQDVKPIAVDSSDSSATASGDYPFSIQVSLDQSLHEVKQQMLAVLTSTSQPQPNEMGDKFTTDGFYCRRSGAVNAPQLKDESKTLRDLAVVSHSVLHLQVGKGCKAGEHLLRFELDTLSADAALLALTNNKTAATAPTAPPPSSSSSSQQQPQQQQQYVALSELAVSEKMSILQVKKLLFEQWETLSAAAAAAAAVDGSGSGSGNAAMITPPESVHHIRLRDGKGGKASAPLRDDRLIGRCLLGLTDGRRLLVQVLPQPEFIGPDDIVVSLRVAAYEQRKLYPSIDLPLPRSSTIKDLYVKILQLLPHLQEDVAAAPAADTISPAADSSNVVDESTYISIAKGYTTGPALTLKSASKLKWDDPAVIAALHSSSTTSLSSAADASNTATTAATAAATATATRRIGRRTAA